MKIRMEIIKQNTGIIGWHYVNDIAIQTVDTFGRVKTLTDTHLPERYMGKIHA